MKKSFSYNLTQFGSADNTVTEQIKTSDGVKTITTDANTGAVILADSVDEDSLNPVTGAAVATAIAQGGGGVPEYGESDAGKVLQVDAQGDDLVWAVAGGAYTAGNGITISDDGEIAVAIGSGGIQIDTNDDNTLMIADEYGLVHVEEGAILVNHDSTLDETVDGDGHGIIGVTNPVPAPGAADSGKVLTVADANGNYGWATAQGGGSLPAPTSADAYKIPFVNSAGNGFYYDFGAVPDVSTGSSGQVLVNNGSSYGWSNTPNPIKTYDATGSLSSGALRFSFNSLPGSGTFIGLLDTGKGNLASASMPFSSTDMLYMSIHDSMYQVYSGAPIKPYTYEIDASNAGYIIQGSFMLLSGYNDSTMVVNIVKSDGTDITSTLANNAQVMLHLYKIA